MGERSAGERAPAEHAPGERGAGENSQAPAAAASPSRPVGVVERPCLPSSSNGPGSGGVSPSSAASLVASKETREKREWQERILDPSARRDTEAPDPAVIAAKRAADEDRLHNDWANLCRYRAENAALRPSNEPRVVFMGDSITELWQVAHPEFFSGGFIDRGIGAQTTGQILLRFRQDVIALKPSVVHIIAGTNDVAGNGGPTTLETIKNNIASMVDLAAANDIRVVVGSVPPAGGFPWRPSVGDPAQIIVGFNVWLRKFAKDHGVIFADYHEALADERDDMKQTFSNDGVHPNRDGYLMMEPEARRAIEQALADAKAAHKSGAGRDASAKGQGK